MLPMFPPQEPPPQAPRDEPDRAPVATASAARYRVEGMDCAACAHTVEKVVAAIGGAAVRRVVVVPGRLVNVVT